MASTKKRKELKCRLHDLHVSSTYLVIFDYPKVVFAGEFPAFGTFPAGVKALVKLGTKLRVDDHGEISEIELFAKAEC